MRLRPLTEDDWDTIAVWETDPDVLWFSDGGEVRQWTIDEWKPIYRDISTSADMFLIEHNDIPVGTGWVQAMNLDFILAEHPGRDLRRIDLQLDETVWGRRLGTRAIRLMTRHAFDTGADLVFASGIWDFNERRLRAFGACGYGLWRSIPEPDGSRSSAMVYLVCQRPDPVDREP
ncbi:MAG: GNAT family N-acetyltransferase [Acidimicrobiia bacterium]